MYREPARVAIAFSRLVDLATRGRDDPNAGCCLKVQNIPFAGADSLLPPQVAELLEAGRATARRDVEGNRSIYLLPQIWANQAATVTSAHFDEYDAVIAQAAGTRVVSLWEPGRQLNPVRRRLPVEYVRAGSCSIPLNTDLEALDGVEFPREYVVCDLCAREDAGGESNDSGAACQEPHIREDSITLGDYWKVDNRVFSPLDLEATGAPVPDSTCRVAPGDLLFIPRGWWHRMDDDPVDAATDLFQVSFSFWYLGKKWYLRD